MSIFTCSGEIPFFAMQQEEFISGCPSGPVIYRVETHITGQMNLRLDQIDLRPLNAVISCFRMCVVKNIDMFMFAMQLYQIEMYTVEKLQNMK